jgi:hypothetical protein
MHAIYATRYKPLPTDSAQLARDFVQPARTLTAAYVARAAVLLCDLDVAGSPESVNMKCQLAASTTWQMTPNRPQFTWVGVGWCTTRHGS